MKTLIDIPPELEEKIQSLIKKGKCANFNDFVLRSLQNQVIAETEETNPWTHETTNLAPAAQSNNILAPPTEAPTLDPPSGENISNETLWGQLYRFLPMKIGLRVLGNMTKRGLVSHDQFVKHASEAAVQFGYRMKRIDAKNNDESSLSVSFPTHEEKSINRYAVQYLLEKRPEGKLTGMMADMRMANIVYESDVVKVGLTEAGKRFAMLYNPAIDGDGESPLSEEEVEFLLTHIPEIMPKEHKAVLHMLHAIDTGIDSREGLNREMAKFYKQNVRGSEQWSIDHLNIMRAGLLSRVVEFGFVKKEKKGRMVVYLLTESGTQYLESHNAMIRQMEV